MFNGDSLTTYIVSLDQLVERQNKEYWANDIALDDAPGNIKELRQGDFAILAV